MAILFPSGFDTTTGLKEKGKPVDQLQTDLAGATVNGTITRRGQGIFEAGGDSIFVQKTFADFAVAGTTADSLLYSIPGNSYVLIAAIYKEIAGDSVATLNLEIVEPVGGTPLLTGVDGLTASSTFYDTAVLTTGTYIAGPFDLVARLTSTGGNLNTMTQGTWDFGVTYFTFK